MKNSRIISCIIFMVMISIPMRSQTASHWNCDIHAYRYDMTVYVQLKSGGATLSNLSDYEVAAFCDDECRGLATVVTSQDNKEAQFMRIRVRSNTTGGDVISFKAYQKSTDTERTFTKTITFASDTQEGSPSAPLILQMKDFIPGDANGDGEIDVTDIVGIANKILGRASDSFVAVAADVNGDGDVDVTDIVAVANIILRGGGKANSAKVREAFQMLDPQ